MRGGGGEKTQQRAFSSGECGSWKDLCPRIWGGSGNSGRRRGRKSRENTQLISMKRELNGTNLGVATLSGKSFKCDRA